MHVDKFSKDGNVFVMALSPAVAQIASKKIHGNYFDGKLFGRSLLEFNLELELKLEQERY